MFNDTSNYIKKIKAASISRQYCVKPLLVENL